MVEPNPQPVQEAAPQAAPTKGGGGLMGPIVAAIIIVAGIAGIFEFMVKGALEITGAKISEALSAEQKPGGGGSESNLPDALNKHGVIYHACCEANPCCGMDNCCDLKEKKSGEACKNSNCVKISNEKKGIAAKLKAAGN